MPPLELIATILMVVGLLFFLAGTVGILRFPDVYTRLHALTKADNLGLGLVAAGLMIHAGSWVVALKILAVWFFLMFSSSLSAFLVANAAHRHRTRIWRKPS